VGVHFFSRDFSALGEANEYLLPATQRTAAIFAFTEAPIGRLLLQAAARYEDAEMKGTPLSDIPTSTDFSLFSASLGGTFDVTDAVKLGLSASLSERPPGIEELFSRGPHEGDGTYQTGDPNLGAERAVSLEATLRVRQDRFALEGAVWRARFNDYIYGELTGRLCEDDGTCGASGDLRELFWRQRGAVFTGAEAQASYRIAKLSDGTLELRGLADTVRAKLSDGGGDVPRIPPWRIGAGLDWASAKVDAGFMLLRTAEQKDVPAGESTTKGYVNLDAHLAWRPFGQGPELSLTGSNLTDSRQRSATSFNRDEVLQPGREIRLLLRTRF
jgi:iron complex outermembrane receptor protein